MAISFAPICIQEKRAVQQAAAFAQLQTQENQNNKLGKHHNHHHSPYVKTTESFYRQNGLKSALNFKSISHIPTSVGDFCEAKILKRSGMATVGAPLLW